MEQRRSFSEWLLMEVTAARCALLALYEKQDSLKMVERPALERKYMETVGKEEQEVIRQEIECELLEEKERMIQTAINRREPVDEAVIDARIDQLRKDKIGEALDIDSDWSNIEPLDSEDQDAIQVLYRQIVQNYHPQMHPDLPEAHRLLYEKAQDAYRRRDLDALQLIWDTLNSTEGASLGVTMTLEFSISSQSAEEQLEELSTDYTLAKLIYGSFVETEAERAARDELDRCKQETLRVMEEMDHMKQDFPFTAAEMLSDPAQIEEYRKELEFRRLEVEKKIPRMKDRIQNMLAEAKRYE